MNFGKKITILYLSFVALILTLVFMAYSYDIELVSKDYYAQELDYQNKLDAINNNDNLEKSITHQVNENNITLTLPDDMTLSGFSGTIYFFRPSDLKLDRTIKMDFENQKQIISTTILEKGVYKMQLSWKNNHMNFFKENIINIK